MLDSLIEFEVAYNLLKANHENITDLNEKDPIDYHYEQLKCDIGVVPEGIYYFFTYLLNFFLFSFVLIF